MFLLHIKQGHRKYADHKQRQGVGQAEKNTTVIKHIHEQYGKKKRSLVADSIIFWYDQFISHYIHPSSQRVKGPFTQNALKKREMWAVEWAKEGLQISFLLFDFDLILTCAKDTNAMVKHVYLACVYIYIYFDK